MRRSRDTCSSSRTISPRRSRDFMKWTEDVGEKDTMICRGSWGDGYVEKMRRQAVEAGSEKQTYNPAYSGQRQCNNTQAAGIESLNRLNLLSFAVSHVTARATRSELCLLFRRGPPSELFPPTYKHKPIFTPHTTAGRLEATTGDSKQLRHIAATMSSSAMVLGKRKRPTPKKVSCASSRLMWNLGLL